MRKSAISKLEAAEASRRREITEMAQFISNELTRDPSSYWNERKSAWITPSQATTLADIQRDILDQLKKLDRQDGFIDLDAWVKQQAEETLRSSEPIVYISDDGSVFEVTVKPRERA
jgi:hypothetical protein